MPAVLVGGGETVIAQAHYGTATATQECYTVGVTTGIISGDPYEGSYEVTPGAEPQTLATAGLVMRADVTVGAIPQNYGLITWDGSTITVS